MSLGRLAPRAWLLAFAAVSLALAFVASASALDEPYTPTGGCSCHEPDPSTCTRCHQYPVDGQDAGSDGIWSFFPPYNEYMSIGPHGLYTTSTSRCDMCHTLHDAPTGFKLLPGETVKATCFSCHDGTGGQGVYGAIAARGMAPGAGHGIESTRVVPGGDATNGGSATVAFRGPGSTMTCSDCHTPHGSNMVAKFTGERIRIWAGQTQPPPYSSRLLKQKPTGATVAVAEYGSDWCASCHRGRTSGGMVMNHPVDSGAGAYVYGRIPLNRAWDQQTYLNGILNGTPTLTNPVPVVGTLGFVMGSALAHNTSPIPGDPGPDPLGPVSWHASGWLMRYPRVGPQVGHKPICQQCHEDSREVGYLTDDGSQAWIQSEYVYGNTADGRIVGADVANPRFQNFPHETQNSNMLIETGDDLCMNCHPVSQLP